MSLSEKLIQARESRGWSIHAATKRMEGVHNQTLWTLEGNNPHRAPAGGGEMKFKTAIAIASAYFPDISAEDLLGTAHRCLLRFVPKNTNSKQVMRSYQPPPSPPPPSEPVTPLGGAVA